MDAVIKGERINRRPRNESGDTPKLKWPNTREGNSKGGILKSKHSIRRRVLRAPSPTARPHADLVKKK